MCPDITRHRPQQGIGLPMALFVVVILSLVTVATQQLTVSGADNYSRNMASVRAYYAAESAAQQVSAQVLSSTPCGCPAANQTLTFGLTGLNGCSASVSCESWTVNGQTYCTLLSQGQCDNGNASRQLEVRMR